MATAQTAPADPNRPAAETRAEMRGDRGEMRGDRGDRGHRGGRQAGRHGGSGMFAAVFADIDADGNGSVTQAEIDAYRAMKVGEADASGDGALSIEEFDTLYREFTRSRMVDAFQNLDADGDGVITDGEMDARFGDIVKRVDRDDDGALTPRDRGRRG
ncbi:hypothetical protein [Jannaschia rubra]|nr:hypothetical protein [Jannaschia rubra]